MIERRVTETLVVGAGPAGLAAAVRAASHGRRVTVIDDNPSIGGQIWRSEEAHSSLCEAALWFQRFRACGAERITGARVVNGDTKRRMLLAETREGAFEIEYENLVLTPGAREMFVPFPGWTLPNVMGVGGLQALVKSGLPIAGKRIIVAGSGPLLLAATALFRQHGASVPLIAEQANWRRVTAFALHLAKELRKLRQALRLRLSLGQTKYLLSCWVEGAVGNGQVRSATLRAGNKTWEEPCDYLAAGFGFRPNLELPVLLGCRIDAGIVEVDSLQRTSQDNIFCAGECTGVGGVEKSLIEGQIAGHAAARAEDCATKLFGRRNKAQAFAAALARAFALRSDLRSLLNTDTIICRCEDVTWGQLQGMDGWRPAKLETRCGMGACQGRVCSSLLEFLLGWQATSVRPPVFPARLETLSSSNAVEEETVHG